MLYQYSFDFKPIALPQPLEDVLFETNNKGFEGMAMVRYKGEYSDRYLFLLCEGNKCEHDNDGREGRVKVFTQIDDNKTWSLIDTVKLPSTLDWQDYSALDITGSWISVLSQEESKMWIGQLGV